MTEVIVATSSKDSGGIAVIDLTSGSSICPNFKNCIADPGALCFAGSSSSSFAGNGSVGDYIISSQSKKTVIHIWQWSKPQVHMQCHTQEILSAIKSDITGTFVFGGSKKGWIYVWDITTGELIRTLQAHFKAITRIEVDPRGLFCISSSDDGMIRVWDLNTLVESSSEMTKGVSSGKKTFTPFRTWNSHSLSVKDILLLGSMTSLRIASCSADRTMVIQDVHSGKQCLRVSLPHSLESIACNTTEDFIFLGASNGNIYIIDISASAISISASHAHVSHTNMNINSNINSNANKSSQKKIENSTSSSSSLSLASCSTTTTLEGHSKSVTSLTCSIDGVTLISASEDGTIRFWHIWTRQCVREIKPFAGTAVTNAIIVRRPELIGSTAYKPQLNPIEHLAKYTADSKLTGSNTNRQVVLGANVIGHDSTVGETSTKKKRSYGNIDELNTSGILPLVKDAAFNTKSNKANAGTKVSKRSDSAKELEGDFIRMPSANDEGDDGNMSFNNNSSSGNSKGEKQAGKGKGKAKEGKGGAGGGPRKRYAEMVGDANL